MVSETNKGKGLATEEGLAGHRQRHDDRKVSTLIPAAGSGTRLGMGPKALLKLNGRPLITWLVEKLQAVSDEIIVSAPGDLLGKFAAHCPDCRLIQGGETRQESVARLFAASRYEWILLSDAARPFATLDLYRKVLAKAYRTGVAGAFLQSDVPVAQLVNNEIKTTLPAHEAGLFQLPHAFSRAILDDCIIMSQQKNWSAQSTLELALLADYEVGVVPGEKNNIKITSALDLQIAKVLENYLK